MNDMLQQGIAAARAGRREEARALLLRVVEQDERNEQAWLWLSGVTDDPEDVRVCLENVLDLNPNNAKARQGLEWLQAHAFQQTPAHRPVAVAAPPVVSAVDVSRAPVAAPAPVAPPPVAVPQPPAAAKPALGPGQSHCPYCGAVTQDTAQTCAACRTSLMVREQPPATASAALRALIAFWWLGGMIAAIAALVLFVMALLIYQALQFTDETGAIRSTLSPLAFVTLGVAVLVIVGMAATLPRAWQNRALWGYYAGIGVTVLWALVGVVVVLAGPGVLAAFSKDAAVVKAFGENAPAFAGLSGPLGGLILGGQVLIGLLLGLSVRDFIGPLRRFILTLERGTPAEHYRNGVLYKSRGMWYAAAREWESAVKRAPSDINYLRALSLAYARLRRFDDAQMVLARAIQIAPGHAQLLEDKALIEGLAGAPKHASASRP